MTANKNLYEPGQLVRHKRYGYRGVVVDVDSECMASADWYDRNQTQPDRNQPWYHILVSDSDQVTYPAQSSLIPDESCQEVIHHFIPIFFDGFKDGHYIRNQTPWPRE